MRTCGCAGGKCESGELAGLSRREFLGRVAVGTAGLTLLGQLPWLDRARAAPLAARRRRDAVWPDYAMTPPASIAERTWRRSPCPSAASAPAASGSTARAGWASGRSSTT